MLGYDAPVSVERPPVESARRTELLEAIYAYAAGRGLGELSLRPMRLAVGSSPRVLLYLFGSKDDLVRALLVRARTDEVALLDEVRRPGEAPTGLDVAVERIWSWLAAPEHRGLLCLWVEAYARSVTEPDGPWAGFAAAVGRGSAAVRGSGSPIPRGGWTCAQPPAPTARWRSRGAAGSPRNASRPA